jgi:phosphoribosylglycinamide formyltransferase-1
VQGVVKIEENDTLQALEAKIHRLEHKLYPLAINLFITGRLNIIGRRVSIKKRGLHFKS